MCLSSCTNFKSDFQFLTLAETKQLAKRAKFLKKKVFARKNIVFKTIDTIVSVYNRDRSLMDEIRQYIN